MFFSCITAMVENKKAKAGKKTNDSSRSSEEDVEESSNDNCGTSAGSNTLIQILTDSLSMTIPLDLSL